MRKTSTVRTKSAPPLGRVLSDQTYGSSRASPAKAQPSALGKAAVIAELEQSSQVGGVREWKEELKRRQVEEEKNAIKELAQYYNPGNFVAEVPNTDTAGAVIPAWKRQMLAKKAAEKARKEAEEQIKQEAEAKRIASIPPWRRQLLQRRESDGKCAQ
ncbi:unnamed protein product [Allacma fusca]|uniref:Uncharacterized protein n=1 Tax=Allacma fusca TaxID=39272 RepID=A0A8J2P6L6_9HEXA|nr:unnamed protein product [Allacma fusca]